MTDDKIELNRRRVLGGIITLGGAAAAAGAGTFALFSDTESSSDNSVQAGTLDLGPDNPATITQSTNMAPGDTVNHTITLTSDGSLSGSLDIAVDYAENDGNASTDDSTPVSAENFAKEVFVSTITYGGTSQSTKISDVDGDGETSLYDLANNDTEGSDDLANLADPGDGTDFIVDLTLNSNVDNAFQNDGVDVTYTFTLNQQDQQ